jgi:para-aminobenzoate synthetase component 1
VEEHPGLFHLVSDVEGELKENISWREILKEILPVGSISGAPKSSAVKLISKIEPSARSFYCGIFGFIQGEVAQLGVSIRTFYKIGNKLSFGTGAGITWASVAESEWQETELKAKKLIAIASGKI